MSEKAQNTVSLTQGYWFYFNIDGTQIAVHGSSWSGRETIYINDEIITSSRNFRRRNKHCFEYQGNEYCVHFNMVNIWFGKLVCELHIDGALVESQSLAFQMFRKKDGSIDFKKMLILLLPPMIVGFIAGFVSTMTTLN